MKHNSFKKPHFGMSHSPCCLPSQTVFKVISCRLPARAAWLSPGVLWVLIWDLLVLCRFYHNPNTGSDSWLWVTVELGRSPLRKPCLISRGNLNITWVESSGYGLRDTPGNGLQMVGDALSSLLGGCGCASRWPSCLLEEVTRIPAALQHFVEVGTLSLPC